MTGLNTALVMLLLLAAVASGLVTDRYAKDLAAPRAAVSEGAKIAPTAVGPLEYGETGSGTPLLSIHGAGGGFDQGLANAADLVGSGFRIIAPSRFGYLGPVAYEWHLLRSGNFHERSRWTMGFGSSTYSFRFNEVCDAGHHTCGR